MGFQIETQRTDFFNELSEEKRNEYLSIKRMKFLPTIDNIYYTVFIKYDKREDKRLERLMKLLEEKKAEASSLHEPVEFSHGLQVTLKSYKMYRYCLTENDLYDIFICSSIPNNKTPRIVVQLRAMGLWTRNIEEVITDSYNRLVSLLGEYGCEIEKCRENRIDYCYHTNAISSPSVMFRETKGRVKNVYSNLKEVNIHAELEHIEDGTIFHKDYICFGSKESKNVRARVYDKVKEVIENGYKGFFFELWYQNGMINFYDKYCFEYALPYKNVDYIHKARLMFYMEYGTDKLVKKEFELTLSDKNTTLADCKKLADAYMPKTTAVINIEYETMRKFYYYSDKFIDGFKYIPRDVPGQLLRLFKILDNKSVFLDYLTSKTLSFHHKPDSKGEYKYLSWWERLRNTKLGGIKSDEKLLRDYSHEMDKRQVIVKTINNIASSAVYDDNLETGFIEDASDFLSCLNDNDAYRMNISIYDDEGEVISNIESNLLKYYNTKKQAKERLLKNRKKKQREKHDLTSVEGG